MSQTNNSNQISSGSDINISELFTEQEKNNISESYEEFYKNILFKNYEINIIEKDIRILK